MLTYGVSASRWAAHTKVIFTVLTGEHRVVWDVNRRSGLRRAEGRVGSIGIPELLIIFMILGMGGVILIWPAARICRRIGFSPWLGLLAAVPIVNIVLLWLVAFIPWPVPVGQRGA